MGMNKRWKLGILGCGNIAGIYVSNIKNYFKNIEIVSVAARHPEHAEKFAIENEIPKAYSKENMLADRDVQVILNLTVPDVHYSVNLEILEAGKHLYCEKPLAGSCEEIKVLKKTAAEKNLMIGSAPDTWLGPGIQTAAELIRTGQIGRPVFVTANLMNHGTETWHPSPFFYYKKGGGPVMDMGPYYISALTALLGPVSSVYSFNVRSMEERQVYSNPCKGRKISVEVATSCAGILEFRSGVIGNINLSFDAWQSDLPMLEIYGTEGKIRVPDPNWFDGPIELIRQERILREIDALENEEKIAKINTLKDWYPEEKVEKIYCSVSDNLRGLGLWLMLKSVDGDGEYPNNAEWALYVMEVLEKLAGNNKDPLVKNSYEVKRVPVWELEGSELWQKK